MDCGLCILQRFMLSIEQAFYDLILFECLSTVLSITASSFLNVCSQRRTALRSDLSLSSPARRL